MRFRIGAVLCMLYAFGAASAEISLYVERSGDDDNPGTEEKPFATLARARDEIRARRKNDGVKLPVTVWISGVTSLSRGFVLTEQDSGTAEAPVVYRGKGDARIIGGIELTAGVFTRVTKADIFQRLDGRLPILQVDLKLLGITDYGELRPRGFGRPEGPAAMELFFQDRPMPLARWPNTGWATIKTVPGGPDGGKFTCDAERLKNWSFATEMWVHGYWNYDWADSYVKVESIDSGTNTITTQAPHGVMGYVANRRFRVLNLLEEIDEPGEWFLDRKNGLLYFLPPGPVEDGNAIISICSTPLLKMQNVSYVTVRGLTFEACRGDGIEIDGCSQCLIAGCTVRNTGNYGIKIKGGKENGVQSCDIHGCGDGGINLGGGDRKTLTPAGNFAVNNHIHHFSRWCRTYRPGVNVWGVGNRVANNLIHDAPHNAIHLSGNDHIVEFNDVHTVCTDTGDAGAFYMGRDWTARGNVIRNNHFHDLMRSLQDQKDTFTDVMGVYLDDLASGTTITGNVFTRVSRAVQIGGGRDNVLENNIFVDCTLAIHLDARGIGWAKEKASETGDWHMYKKLSEMKHTEPPYSTRYPLLATILENEPAAPKGNSVKLNITTNCKVPINLHGADPVNWGLKDNFFDEQKALPENAGLKSIPMEKIGLFKDEYRPKLPAETK